MASKDSKPVSIVHTHRQVVDDCGCMFADGGEVLVVDRCLTHFLAPLTLHLFEAFFGLYKKAVPEPDDEHVQALIIAAEEHLELIKRDEKARATKSNGDG